jgi:hypothetical protein
MVRRYKSFTGGKFDVCIKNMRKILYQIPLLVVQMRTDVEDTQELMEKCREYILACNVELERRKVRTPSSVSTSISVHLCCDLRAASKLGCSV